MWLSKLQIGNLRCFSTTELNFAPGINLIEGANGSGKTSILEALHYLCYLRSFRTYYTRELIQIAQPGFFIRANFTTETLVPTPAATYQLQVGFTPQKRIVKIDQVEIKTYNELLSNYRAISFVEDDLDLIKGQPLVRRTFLDQYLALYVPEYLKISAEYKRILANRNSLISNNLSLEKNRPEYLLWTEQLNHKSIQIQALRAQALIELQYQVNLLLTKYFSETNLSIELTYRPKTLNQNLELLITQESRLRRTIFGAHLDDFVINFSNLRSRIFASRGQQKLILTLLKIAQYLRLTINSNHAETETGGAFLFLLDDFMTDLDEHWLQILVQALQDLNCQLIFTCPTQAQSTIKTVLQKYHTHIISL